MDTGNYKSIQLNGSAFPQSSTDIDVGGLTFSSADTPHGIGHNGDDDMHRDVSPCPHSDQFEFEDGFSDSAMDEVFESHLFSLDDFSLQFADESGSVRYASLSSLVQDE